MLRTAGGRKHHRRKATGDLLKQSPASEWAGCNESPLIRRHRTKGTSHDDQQSRHRRAGGGDAQGDRIAGFENIIGSGFDDLLRGSSVASMLQGGAGNDTLIGGKGADQMDGGSGIDTVDYSGSAQGVAVSLLAQKGFEGDAAGDAILNVENLVGSGFGDRIGGGHGANTLNGGAGNDFITGNRGRDILTGGKGADFFYFLDIRDSGSTAATRDHITDFSHAEGDKIYLGFIDAKQGSAEHDGFTFIGSKAFTAEGQVRFFFEGDHTVVEANTAGASGADMQIELAGHVSLSAFDFVF